jgi:hypothetical protein
METNIALGVRGPRQASDESETQTRQWNDFRLWWVRRKMDFVIVNKTTKQKNG